MDCLLATIQVEHSYNYNRVWKQIMNKKLHKDHTQKATLLSRQNDDNGQPLYLQK